MTVEFLTPVGRIVWGNPSKAQKKTDQKTRQPVIRDGKQVEQWAFGLAIPKNEFNQLVLPYLQQEVGSVYPHGVPPQFSWKFKDGDGVDRAGKPYNQREGYAGHYVLTISTEAFAPPIYKNEGGRYRQIEPHEIKTGDYAVVKLNAKGNAPTNPTHTPGLYINPIAIELVGYGQEIVSSGVDPDEAFGGRTYQLPPGATATPQAPVGGGMAPYAMPAQPAAAPAPAQYAPVPQYTPPVTPAAVPGVATYAAPYQAPQAPAQYAPVPQAAPVGQLPPPAHDFVRNAGQPPAQPAAAPAPAQYAPVPQAAPVATGGYPTGGYPPQMPGIPTGR